MAYSNLFEFLFYLLQKKKLQSFIPGQLFFLNDTFFVAHSSMHLLTMKYV
jgi:hypothetical protein